MVMIIITIRDITVKAAENPITEVHTLTTITMDIITVIIITIIMVTIIIITIMKMTAVIRSQHLYLVF